MDLQDLILKQQVKATDHLSAIHGFLKTNSESNENLKKLVEGVGKIQSLEDIETLLMVIYEAMEDIKENTSKTITIPEVNLETTNKLLATLIEESRKPCQIDLKLE